MNHKRSTYIFYGIIFIIMWIIGGWNTDNGDFSNYEEMYTYDILAMTTSNTPDYGFFLILEGFKLLDLSLIQARIVIYFIFLTTLSFLIFKLSKRPILVVLLYFLTLYFRDVILLRNTVAMIFLYIGIYFYISQEYKHRKIIFFFMVLIATTIHISFLFYLVVLLADKNIKFGWIAWGSILLAFIGKPILSLFSSYIVSEENGQLQQKVGSMLESGSYFSLIICTIVVLLSVYMCKEAYRIVKIKSIVSCKAILDINVIMSCILVLTSVTMSFIRMFYNILFFDYILVSNALFYRKKISFVQILWFVWIYLWAFWMSNVSSNFSRILANNLVFNSI